MAEEPPMAVEPLPIATPAPRCADCGERLHGPFCSACGQEQRGLERLTVGQLTRDWLGDVFSFDSRVWRTLVALVRRPGLLTREYLAGRRARYVPPLRLFVFLSLIMLLVLGFTGTRLKFSLDQDGEEIVSSERKIADLDPERINLQLLDRLPQVLLILTPVFALFVWLLHRRRQPFYLPHLIFSLHVHGFGCLLMIASKLLDLPFPLQFQPGLLLFIIGGPIYLYLAQRRVYGGGRLVNVARTAALGIIHNFVLLLAMLALLALTVFLSSR